MPSLKEYKEAYRRAALAERRSARELIDAALAEDEDTAWRLIGILHNRGDRATFEAASDSCQSENPKERAWGAAILGQLGSPKRSFPDESADILLGMLPGEQEAEVLAAIAVALGYIGDQRRVVPLAALSNHPDTDVRYAVVHGLSGQEDDLAIRTLIALSADEDTAVRDWATFGLGTQIGTDTSEVREALFARLADEDEDTRGEAFVGLARRHDLHIIEPLIRELSSLLTLKNAKERSVSLFVEAARDIGSPHLYPALLELREWWGLGDKVLEEAIARCKGEAV